MSKDDHQPKWYPRAKFINEPVKPWEPPHLIPHERGNTMRVFNVVECTDTPSEMTTQMYKCGFVDANLAQKDARIAELEKQIILMMSAVSEFGDELVGINPDIIDDDSKSLLSAMKSFVEVQSDPEVTAPVLNLCKCRMEVIKGVQVLNTPAGDSPYIICLDCGNFLLQHYDNEIDAINAWNKLNPK